MGYLPEHYDFGEIVGLAFVVATVPTFLIATALDA
jgi:hypothetical protein